MAHLITDHDPYHVHKTLGLLVLLHYLYRYYLVFAYGTAFPEWSTLSSPSSSSSSSSRTRLLGSPPPPSILLDALAMLLHGALSWSSLLLPLPRRRNFDRPMIWPEFRYHSILFASRHVVCAIVSLLGLWPDAGTYLDCIARLGIISGTSIVARAITHRHGDRERRTTNSMPYPTRYVNADQIGSIRALYATAQFGATITCLSSDPSVNLSPLLGIQMAPLLMTLVRKNRIGCGSYHACYAASLFLGYVVVYVRMLSYVSDDRRGGYDGVTAASIVEVWDGIYLTTRLLVLFGLPFSRMRRDWGVPALAFWFATVPFATIALPMMWKALVVDEGGAYHRYAFDEATSTSRAYAIRDILAVIVRTSMTMKLTSQAITYAPLLGMGISPSGTTGAETCTSDERDDARVTGTSWGTKGGEGNIDDPDKDDDGDDTESSSSSSPLD
ncbi:hypothetical protein ACHAXA_000841 [Cyclostephanos tholiformis]|uniref:Uncharacterized protein n=1 Tax=Cyclostephanos tholiformis TaxID=382380 RepID=A0ABD3SRQ5_9STRA